MNLATWFTNRFSNRGKAVSLYKRGMAKAKNDDHQGAIVDYTTAIGMTATPADVKGMAQYNRALAYAASGNDRKAMEDIDVVLAMTGAPISVKTEARRMLVRIERRSTDANT